MHRRRQSELSCGYRWLESKLYECGIIGDETKRHKVRKGRDTLGNEL